MKQSRGNAVIALDVGEKRIGIAAADGVVPIARPLGAIDVDGQEIERIKRYLESESADTIVIGYPRNQSGEPTAQTVAIETFKKRLSESVALRIVFQDESLTSVLAEEQLRQQGKPYTKGDIDARAAALILQDYLETNA